MTNNIYKQVEDHIKQLFSTHDSQQLYFHSLAHTQEMIKRTEEIATHYKLSEKEMMAVCIAGWFHDTGYLFTTPENHEEKSVEQMKLFMETNFPDPELIKTIEGCIMATKIGVVPSTLLQQIVCDADTYHLGTKEFKKTNKQVKKEIFPDNSYF